MNREHSLDDVLADWLEDGPTRAPDDLLRTVLAAIPSIPQRRRRSWGGRGSRGSGVLAFAVAAAALLLAGAIGLGPLGPGDRFPANGGPVDAALPSRSSGAVEATLDPGIAKAMDFREQYGLRADRVWAEQVARDPTATLEYGVPLLPSETAELRRRAAEAEKLIPIIRAYGAANVEEFGGVYVDQRNGGIPVALFTANLAKHEAAIRAELPPGARFAVRAARFTERELRALQERIVADDAELRRDGIAAIRVSTDPVTGTIPVEVSTERTDAADVLVARYGEAVRVTVLDPTGAYLEPPGTIEGRVIDSNGRPVAGAAIDRRPLFADIALPASGIGSQADGRFRLERMLPGRWRIGAEREGFEPASVEIDLPAGGVVTIEIVLRPTPFVGDSAPHEGVN